MKIILPIFAIALGATIAMWYDGKFDAYPSLAFWNSDSEPQSSASKASEPLLTPPDLLPQNGSEITITVPNEPIASTPNSNRVVRTDGTSQVGVNQQGTIQSKAINPATQASGSPFSFSPDYLEDENSSHVEQAGYNQPDRSKLATKHPHTSPKPEAPLNDATELLDRVRQEIHRHKSITAKIRYRINMYGHEMIGNGEYWQSGLGDQKLIRMQLKLLRKFKKQKEDEEDPNVPFDQFATSLQIVDGQYLWNVVDTFKEQVTRRVNLQRVLNEQERHPELRKPEDDGLWRWAGLPKLLVSLRGNFAWDNVVNGHLEPDKTPVFAIHGEWAAKSLSHISINQKQHVVTGDALSASWLPSQMPGKITLYIRQSDFFPQRIEYYPAPDSKTSTEGEKMLVVEFIDVVLDQPIDERNFVFNPNGADFMDTTVNVLEGLGLMQSDKEKNDKESTAK